MDKAKQLWDYINQDKNRFLQLNEHGKKTYLQYGWDNEYLKPNELTEKAMSYITMAPEKKSGLDKIKGLGSSIMDKSHEKAVEKGFYSPKAETPIQSTAYDSIKKLTLPSISEGLNDYRKKPIAKEPIEETEWTKKHPILSNVLQGAGELASAPLRALNKVPFLDRVSSQAANVMLMDDSNKLKPTGSKVGDIASQVIGTGIGYAMPIQGLGTGLWEASDKIVGKTAENIAGKATRKLTPTLAKTITRFAKGTARAGSLGALEGYAKDMEGKDIAKKALTEGAIGGAFEVGTGAISDLIAKRKPIKPILDEPIKEPIAEQPIEPLEKKLPKAKEYKTLTKEVSSKDYVPISVEEKIIGENAKVTVYKLSEGKLKDGDIVTASKELAEEYASKGGKVIEEKISAKNLFAKQGQGIDELLYSPKGIKPETVGQVFKTKPIEPLIKPVEPIKQASKVNMPKAIETPLKGELKPRKFVSNSMMGAEVVPDKMKEELAKSMPMYKPISNKDTWEKATKLVTDNKSSALEKFKALDYLKGADDTALGEALIVDAINSGDMAQANSLTVDLAEKLTEAGRAVQAASIMKRLSPEGMLMYANRTVSKINKTLPADKHIKITDEFAKQITDSMKRIQDNDLLIDLIKEQHGGKLPKWVESYLNNATNERLKDLATEQVIGKIGDLVPPSTAQKIKSIQAFSHLLNFKTILRNIVGNTAFEGVEIGSNTTATVYDQILSHKTGQRTVALPQLKGTLTEGLRRGKESAVEIALGVDKISLKHNTSGTVFKTGALGKVEKAMGYSLGATDDFAKGIINKDVTQQLELLGGFTKDEIAEIAHKAELYGTFQDRSLPAQILQGANEVMNKIGIGKTVRGKTGMLTKEFGMGDFLIRYTTVPGNLISRAVEYSPAGFIKALNMVSKGYDKLNQRDIAMALGRATNGTLLIGMGALANRLGLIVSEDKERDKKAISLERSEGLGNSKVNIDGFMRYFNGESAKAQPGDKLMSFSSFEPVGVSLAVGATLDNELRREGLTTSVVFKAMNAALEDILDIPTLSIIRKMTYADGVFDMAITPITEGITGFIPGPVRQAASYLDPIARTTYNKGDDKIEGLKRKIIGGTPFAKHTLEPSLSPYGQEQKRAEGIFEGFINPAFSTIYQPYETTKQLKELEELTGESTHYPAINAPNKLTHNKQEIILTSEEKTRFKRTAGEEAYKLHKMILQGRDIESLSSNQQAAVLRQLVKANDRAREKAKRELLINRR